MLLFAYQNGEMTVTEINKKLGPGTSASQHLNVMRMRGILKARRDGTTVYYGIANRKITQACSLMQSALADLMEGVAEISKQGVMVVMEEDA